MYCNVVLCVKLSATIYILLNSEEVATVDECGPEKFPTACQYQKAKCAFQFFYLLGFYTINLYIQLYFQGATEEEILFFDY